MEPELNERPKFVRWLNRDEVAIRLGIKPRQVDHLLNAGKIEWKRVGRIRRVREDWLLAYQQRRRETV